MHVESGYIYVALLLLLRVFLHVDNTLIIMNYSLQFFCLLEYILFRMETPLTELDPMVCILRASPGRSTEKHRWGFEIYLSIFIQPWLL